MLNQKNNFRVIILFWCLLALSFSSGLHGQPNHIDAIRHDAPELAYYGEHNVGVRTLSFTDKDRPDILRMKEGSDLPRYDRSLTVEIWYPAQLKPGQLPGGQYSVMSRNPQITAILHGKGVRDATALKQEIKFPLVIISHGYPGNRWACKIFCVNVCS